MKTLILDCNNLAYIARHAYGNELSHEEEQTGILWGFFNQVWKLARQFETHKFLFAWDSRKSHRKRDFAGYKANRRVGLSKGEKASYDKVYAQFTTLRKTLLPQFGFRNIYMHTGLEADDVIASLVLNTKWEEPPVVVTTDKDLFQLLEFCDVWRPLPGDKKILMTASLFKQTFDIPPNAWVRVRALGGDDSDNLGGVGGIGSKLAIKYLHGNLPAGVKRSRITSADGQLIMQRNVRLMTLPHPLTPVFPAVQDERFMVDDFIQICDRYRFNHFLKTENLQEWRKLFHMEG